MPGRPRDYMTLGRAWAQPGPAADQQEAEGGRCPGLGPQKGKAGEARVEREERKQEEGCRWGQGHPRLSAWPLDTLGTPTRAWSRNEQRRRGGSKLAYVTVKLCTEKQCKCLLNPNWRNSLEGNRVNPNTSCFQLKQAFSDAVPVYILYPQCWEWHGVHRVPHYLG